MTVATKGPPHLKLTFDQSIVSLSKDTALKPGPKVELLAP